MAASNSKRSRGGDTSEPGELKYSFSKNEYEYEGSYQIEGEKDFVTYYYVKDLIHISIKLIMLAYYLGACVNRSSNSEQEESWHSKWLFNRQK
jgi:hypothetical protein